MPGTLAPEEFDRWLSEDENPRDLMRPFERPDDDVASEHAGEQSEER